MSDGPTSDSPENPALLALLRELEVVAAAHEQGATDLQLEESRHSDGYQAIAAAVNRIVAVRKVHAEAVDSVLTELSEGNFAVDVPAAFENAPGLSLRLEMIRESFSGVLREIRWIEEASREGRLTERGSSNFFTGEWEKIILAVNELHSAAISPVREHTRVLTKISRGDLSENLTTECRGEHAALQHAVNTLHAWLRGLIAYVERLSHGDLDALIAKASDEDEIYSYLVELRTAIAALVDDSHAMVVAASAGDLSRRSDATRHRGKFAEVVSGLNSTLDAIDRPLSTAANKLTAIARGQLPDKIVDRYHGQFESLRTSVNMCIDNVRHLVDDAGILSRGAVEGKLQTRVDSSMHQGDFRQIVVGVNSTLDTVIAHFREAASYIGRMAVGDIPSRIIEPYRGDFNVIKEDINALTTSLNDVAALSQRLADGDLTVDVSPRSPGDVLLIAFQKMVASLNLILSEVVTVTEQVTQSATELADRNTRLFEGAQQTAATVEELGASLLALATQSSDIAGRATSASKLAETARQSASVGNDQMQDMVAAMKEIDESSQRISKIIKVIDEIAFQTNLLALNAAVEAARAGHHGKGFAVVAEEVRSLAARSSKAAEQTSELIDTSARRVARGAEIAGRTAKEFHQIFTQVGEVTTLMGEIAGASQRQASELQGTTTALAQIDEVTRDTTEAAETSANATKELLRLAQGLRDKISRFKLREPSATLAGAPDWVTPELLEQFRMMMQQGSAGVAMSSPAALAPTGGGPSPAPLADLDLSF